MPCFTPTQLAQWTGGRWTAQPVSPLSGFSVDSRLLRAGQVFVNNYGAGGGVELPFGGVAHSGYGREKGFEALYAFTTLKTVAAHHG